MPKTRDTLRWWGRAGFSLIGIAAASLALVALFKTANDIAVTSLIVVAFLSALMVATGRPLRSISFGGAGADLGPGDQVVEALEDEATELSQGDDAAKAAAALIDEAVASSRPDVGPEPSRTALSELWQETVAPALLRAAAQLTRSPEQIEMKPASADDLGFGYEITLKNQRIAVRILEVGGPGWKSFVRTDTRRSADALRSEFRALLVVAYNPSRPENGTESAQLTVVPGEGMIRTAIVYIEPDKPGAMTATFQKALLSLSR